MHSTTIIVPLNDNDGSSNAKVIEQTIRTMCYQFGGATSWTGNGFWVDGGMLYEDPIMIIQAATADPSREPTRAIAQTVLDNTDQLAVFVTYPDGQSEIIDR